MREYVQMFAKTFDFKSKSDLRDFWIAELFNILFCILFCLLALPYASDLQVLLKAVLAFEGLYNVIIFLPSISLVCRRLRDAGFSPFVILIGVTGIGVIILLFLCCMPSKLSIQPTNNDNFQTDFAENINEQYNIQNENFEQSLSKTEQNLMQNQPNNEKNEQNNQNFGQNKIVQKSETAVQNDPTEQEKLQPQSVATNKNIENKNQNDLASQTKTTQSKTRKTTKTEQVSRSQKIKLLQQKRDVGEISVFEYQQEILKLLSK